MLHNVQNWSSWYRRRRYCLKKYEFYKITSSFYRIIITYLVAHYFERHLVDKILGDGLRSVEYQVLLVIYQARRHRQLSRLCLIQSFLRYFQVMIRHFRFRCDFISDMQRQSPYFGKKSDVAFTTPPWLMRSIKIHRATPPHISRVKVVKQRNFHRHFVSPHLKILLAMPGSI